MALMGYNVKSHHAHALCIFHICYRSINFKQHFCFRKTIEVYSTVKWSRTLFVSLFNESTSLLWCYPFQNFTYHPYKNFKMLDIIIFLKNTWKTIRHFYSIYLQVKFYHFPLALYIFYMRENGSMMKDLSGSWWGEMIFSRLALGEREREREDMKAMLYGFKKKKNN